MKRKLRVLFLFFTIFTVVLFILSTQGSNSPRLEESFSKANDDFIYYEKSGSHKNTPGETKAQSKSQEKPGVENTVLVIRVIDGDTIEIEGGQKVRYIGIDTPETSDPRTGLQCFGKEATEKNKSLVAGKKVRLEKDISETDKYGRLLSYIFIEDQFVNELLVKEGYAYSSPYPPDIKYQYLIDAAEEFAQKNNKGLWGSCGFVASEKITSSPSSCPIKGNISAYGEKIYHMPGQKYYNKTVISESKGERWFCREDEAEAAGWRRSKL